MASHNIMTADQPAHTDNTKTPQQQTATVYGQLYTDYAKVMRTPGTHVGELPPSDDDKLRRRTPSDAKHHLQNPLRAIASKSSKGSGAMTASAAAAAIAASAHAAYASGGDYDVAPRLPSGSTTPGNTSGRFPSPGEAAQFDRKHSSQLNTAHAMPPRPRLNSATVQAIEQMSSLISGCHVAELPPEDHKRPQRQQAANDTRVQNPALRRSRQQQDMHAGVVGSGQLLAPVIRPSFHYQQQSDPRQQRISGAPASPQRSSSPGLEAKLPQRSGFSTPPVRTASDPGTLSARPSHTDNNRDSDVFDDARHYGGSPRDGTAGQRSGSPHAHNQDAGFSTFQVWAKGSKGHIVPVPTKKHAQQDASRHAPCGAHHARHASDGDIAAGSDHQDGDDTPKYGLERHLTSEHSSADAAMQLDALGLFAGAEDDEDDDQHDLEKVLSRQGPPWYKMRYWRVMMGVQVAAMGLLVTGIVLQSQVDNQRETNTESFRWFYCIAGAPTIWLFIDIICHYLYRLMEWWFFSESLLYLRNVQRNTVTFIFLLMLLPWYKAIFYWLWCENERCEQDTYTQAVDALWRVLLCVMLFTMANLLKCVAAKLLSIHFYRSAHFLKLQAALEKEVFLQVLSRPKRKVLEEKGWFKVDPDMDFPGKTTVSKVGQSIAAVFRPLSVSERFSPGTRLDRLSLQPKHAQHVSPKGEVYGVNADGRVGVDHRVSPFTKQHGRDDAAGALARRSVDPAAMHGEPRRDLQRRSVPGVAGHHYSKSADGSSATLTSPNVTSTNGVVLDYPHIDPHKKVEEKLREVSSRIMAASFAHHQKPQHVELVHTWVSAAGVPVLPPGVAPGSHTHAMLAQASGSDAHGEHGGTQASPSGVLLSPQPVFAVPIPVAATTSGQHAHRQSWPNLASSKHEAATIQSPPARPTERPSKQDAQRPSSYPVIPAIDERHFPAHMGVEAGVKVPVTKASLSARRSAAQQHGMINSSLSPSLAAATNTSAGANEMTASQQQQAVTSSPRSPAARRTTGRISRSITPDVVKSPRNEKSGSLASLQGLPPLHLRRASESGNASSASPQLPLSPLHAQSATMATVGSGRPGSSTNPTASSAVGVTLSHPLPPPAPLPPQPAPPAINASSPFPASSLPQDSHNITISRQSSEGGQHNHSSTHASSHKPNRPGFLGRLFGRKTTPSSPLVEDTSHQSSAGGGNGVGSAHGGVNSPGSSRPATPYTPHTPHSESRDQLGHTLKHNLNRSDNNNRRSKDTNRLNASAGGGGAGSVVSEGRARRAPSLSQTLGPLGQDIIKQVPLNRTRDKDLSQLTEAELEQVRTAVVIKTYTALIRNYSRQTAEDQDRELKAIKAFSKALFKNIRGNEINRPYITYDDFCVFFESEDHASRAFAVFDMDGDGEITRKEVREAVEGIFRERSTMADSLRDTDSIVQTLEWAVGAVTHFLFLAFYLLIFQVDIVQGFSTFSAVILAFTFVFGNAVKNMFEAMLFLFVTHPYDVGDNVSIEGEVFRIKKITLLVTEMIRINGERVFYPNNKLIDSIIDNWTRSRSKTEFIQIQTDVGVPPHVVADIMGALIELAEANPSEYDGLPFVQYRDLRDPMKVVLQVSWSYAFPPDNWKRLIPARNSMYGVLQAKLHEHHLRCTVQETELQEMRRIG